MASDRAIAGEWASTSNQLACIFKCILKRLMEYYFESSVVSISSFYHNTCIMYG